MPNQDSQHLAQDLIIKNIETLTLDQLKYIYHLSNKPLEDDFNYQLIEHLLYFREIEKCMCVIIRLCEDEKFTLYHNFVYVIDKIIDLSTEEQLYIFSDVLLRLVVNCGLPLRKKIIVAIIGGNLNSLSRSEIETLLLTITRHIERIYNNKHKKKKVELLLELIFLVTDYYSFNYEANYDFIREWIQELKGINEEVIGTLLYDLREYYDCFDEFWE